MRCPCAVIRAQLKPGSLSALRPPVDSVWVYRPAVLRPGLGRFGLITGLGRDWDWMGLGLVLILSVCPTQTNAHTAVTLVRQMRKRQRTHCYGSSVPARVVTATASVPALASDLPDHDDSGESKSDSDVEDGSTAATLETAPAPRATPSQMVLRLRPHPDSARLCHVPPFTVRTWFPL